MSRRVYRTRRHESDPHDLESGPAKWRWYEPTGYVFFEAWPAVGALGLRGEDYRLLCGLLGHLDWNNRVRATVSAVGRSVGLTGPHASRAMRRLVMARLVVCERQQVGQAYEVTLSPHLCWKGRPWHLARARQDFLAAWQLRHGRVAPPPPRRRGSSPPSMGPRVAGETPSIVQRALDLLSSL